MLGVPALLVTVALSLVVALRRRWPERMLVLATLTGLAQIAIDVPTMLSDFALLVIVYTVAADGVAWASRFALIAGFAAAPCRCSAGRTPRRTSSARCSSRSS